MSADTTRGNPVQVGAALRAKTPARRPGTLPLGAQPLAASLPCFCPSNPPPPPHVNPLCRPEPDFDN